jgi:hypothetical protein
MDDKKKDDELIGKVGGLVAAETARGLENTQISKFYVPGGTGFAAEDSQILSDKFRLREVLITGPNNKLNGPDRIVDGTAIQTKYFQTSRGTIEAAFDLGTGRYRYGGQVLEVPSDQYDECVPLMKAKILEGRVPGITDPNEAEQIVKKGCVTYKQARNIARAGNIDSLLYDVQSGAVTTCYVFAISFSVDLAKRIWSGESRQDAIKGALHSGVAAGGASLVAGVITAQILRMSTAAVGVVATRGLVNSVSSTSLGRAAIQNLATASLGRSVYGAAAANHVSKLLRTNSITAAVTTAVITAPDFYRAALARTISWGQFTKNLLVNVSGVAAGTGGWMLGAGAGAAIGSAFPLVGTAAGAIVGGIFGALLGGFAGSSVTKAVMDELIEDDANRMMQIVQKVAEELARDYLMSEKEMADMTTMLKATVDRKWMRQMYQSGCNGGSANDRERFAHDCFDRMCQEIVCRREKVTLPSLGEIQEQIEAIVAEAPAEISLPS